MAKKLDSLGKGFAAGNKVQSGSYSQGVTRTAAPASKTSASNGQGAPAATDSFTCQIGPRGQLHSTKDQAC